MTKESFVSKAKDNIIENNNKRNLNSCASTLLSSVQSHRRETEGRETKYGICVCVIYRK